jgi:nitrite reductase/ring-hydroxylating ferredoxin subunit
MNPGFDPHLIPDALSLSPGQGRRIQIAGSKLALFNVGGEFHVLDDVCPHRGAPLGLGFVDGCEVHCPMHGWVFDIRTGACGTNPSKPARTFPTEVRGGEVWVHLPPATPAG